MENDVIFAKQAELIIGIKLFLSTMPAASYPMKWFLWDGLP